LKTYLDQEELEKLEAAAANARDRLSIRLLTHTGCRISEMLGIRIRDIDFVQHVITIKHLKVRIGLTCSKCGARLGKIHRFCPKCGLEVNEIIRKELTSHRYRRIPVDEATLKTLRDYLNRDEPTAPASDTPVFKLNRHRAWQIVSACAEKVGLPKLINMESGKTHNVSPHRLRDAFAVHAMKSNDSIEGARFLQVHLGHASFDTTAKYRKVSGEEQQQWYQKLWKVNSPPASAEK
jgi:integrase/recombinase XerD